MNIGNSTVASSELEPGEVDISTADTETHHVPSDGVGNFVSISTLISRSTIDDWTERSTSPNELVSYQSGDEVSSQSLHVLSQLPRSNDGASSKSLHLSSPLPWSNVLEFYNSTEKNGNIQNTSLQHQSDTCTCLCNAHHGTISLQTLLCDERRRADELDALLATALSEKRMLQKEKQEERESRKLLERKCVQLAEDMTDARLTVTHAYQQRLLESQENLQSIARELARVTNERDRLRTELSNSQHDIPQIKIQLENQQISNELLTHERDSLLNNVAQSRANVRSLQLELEMTKRDNIFLMTDLTKSRQDYEMLKKHLDVIRAEYNRQIQDLENHLKNIQLKKWDDEVNKICNENDTQQHCDLTSALKSPICDGNTGTQTCVACILARDLKNILPIPTKQHTQSRFSAVSSINK